MTPETYAVKFGGFYFAQCECGYSVRAEGYVHAVELKYEHGRQHRAEISKKVAGWA